LSQLFVEGINQSRLNANEWEHKNYNIILDNSIIHIIYLLFFSFSVVGLNNKTRNKTI